MPIVVVNSIDYNYCGFKKTSPVHCEKRIDTNRFIGGDTTNKIKIVSMCKPVRGVYMRDNVRRGECYGEESVTVRGGACSYL